MDNKELDALEDRLVPDTDVIISDISDEPERVFEPVVKAIDGK